MCIKQGEFMNEPIDNAFEGRIFEDLYFKRHQIETPGTGAFVCYEGKDGCFYRLHTNANDETVIEYAESLEDAENNAFWDADWFSGSEEERIEQIRKALLEYINQ